MTFNPNTSVFFILTNKLNGNRQVCLANDRAHFDAYIAAGNRRMVSQGRAHRQINDSNAIITEFDERTSDSVAEMADILGVILSGRYQDIRNFTMAELEAVR